MNSLLSKLVDDLHSKDRAGRTEAISVLSLLWEWQVLGRSDSADLLQDAALLAAKFTRTELEAAFREVLDIAMSGHDDIGVRLTALSAIRVTNDFRCVEIGAQLLITRGDDLKHHEAAELLFYISPYFGSNKFAQQVKSLSLMPELKLALEKLKQRSDHRVVEASKRLLNSLARL